MKKTLKNKKIKNRTIKRKYRRHKKIIGGEGDIYVPNLVNPLNTALFSDAKLLPTGINTMPESIKEKLMEKNSALKTYQEKSAYINTFLREGIDNADYLLKSIDDDIDDETFIEDIKITIEDTLIDINEIDSLFTSTLPTRTVLFRGTDKHYEESISDGYTSTTKSLENLFTMMKNEKGDKFISPDNKCCLNILIVDKGIPYLDLEMTNPTWDYQQEILLPRGLKPILLQKNAYNYDGNTYKTYIYHIQHGEGSTYEIPKTKLILNDDDELDITKTDLPIYKKHLRFLFTMQKKEIDNLFTYLNNGKDTSDVVDLLSSIDFDINNYSRKGVIYLCTKSLYEEIRDDILNQLKRVALLMKKKDLMVANCKEEIDLILEDIHDIISNNQIITSENIISIPKCVKN